MASLYDLGSALLGAVAAHPLVAALVAIAAVAALVTVARRRAWPAAMRRHPRAALGVLVPILVVGLPLGWYLTSPLVLSATLDEPPPVVAQATATPTGGPTPTSSPASPGVESPTSAPSGSGPTPAPTPTPTPTPELIARSGPFHGSDEFHFGRGIARLIETSPGTFVVRLERFAVRNGPDLYVYLSPSANGYAEGAIELGRLKADTGNQNYAVPAGALADPGRAASVVIWCRQFSHLFATAPLAA